MYGWVLYIGGEQSKEVIIKLSPDMEGHEEDGFGVFWIFDVC